MVQSPQSSISHSRQYQVNNQVTLKQTEREVTKIMTYFLKKISSEKILPNITSTPRRQNPVNTSSNMTGIFRLLHSLTSTRWKRGSIMSIPPAPCITTQIWVNEVQAVNTEILSSVSMK